MNSCLRIEVVGEDTRGITRVKIPSIESKMVKKPRTVRSQLLKKLMEKNQSR